MTFEQARVVFMDITKRTMKFPSASVDAYQLPLVAVPTTSGTGAEITPFAVIRDGKTGKKYPLADYCMTPQVSQLGMHALPLIVVCRLPSSIPATRIPCPRRLQRTQDSTR
jgi:hypothetical protein